MRTQNLKFSHKILLVAALIVALAFACFILFNDYRQRQSLYQNTESTMDELGALTTSNVQTWLQGRIALLQSMAQQLAAQGTEQEQLRSIIGLPAYPANFQLSYFGSAQGLMFSIPTGNRPADYDPRVRGWYKAASAAGAATVTEPYIAASSGKMVVTVAAPVQRDGQLSGVAGADIDLSQISNIINSLNFDGHGQAFIVSASGKILIHPDPKLVLKPLAEAFPQGAPALTSGLKEVEFNGKPQLLSFTQVKGVPSADWYVGLMLEKDAAYSMLGEFRTSALIATVIAVLVIIGLLGVLIRVLMAPLRVMGKAMEDIAQGEGDLTRRLAIHGNDEFGQLGSAFNRFLDRIHESIREVSSATAQVHEVAGRVVHASNASMGKSDQQAQRTNSVAAAINELGAAAQEIAHNAALASQHSSEARNLASQGQQVVDSTITAMGELSAKISDSCSTIETLNTNTVNIGQILEVITGISQQTNLLALNAAIEAARAGEAGRGFAVVADEVRNLAHRTQESAQQVQKLIEELQVGARQAVGKMNESQAQSDNSVGIANQAGERLSSVTVRIGEIDGMNQSVATATEEQTAVVDTINQDISEINLLNQEGVENLQTTLRACGDLEQQVNRLKQLVGSFRI
ncbi:methyl-accepting chemotaxis sensory transducer with Cache sensor [Pseudomonas sp. URIL14HWK12:I9]|nr:MULTISPECIES: methyl-accepting chemotaxis protein [unclassified Pseudomonas]PVZ10290.1 methyl-accepting chemotaxis sensory transducer with Cache sensor [Pseudomonas sp. URIL14HWK12:I12]PVZ21716.1 methyl-accepting chemotaxis sensory transducer with Cache sensor [Pseudomonas sp. URIL14HWK12:I10]PVZ31201.1 methyl-accepting chemotaxis sensory transducer with Cache sensor [Pseudomonas sp. URIL14HWK12:I11]SNZ18022.1 methyl-accepting chemotaxis sensory transducer with Cache sensor [Pseudomonas sp. 